MIGPKWIAGRPAPIGLAGPAGLAAAGLAGLVAAGLAGLAGARSLVTLALVALALFSLASTPAGAQERTLEEVEIEGEVRLPQVLFITSRDSDRPLDWLGAYQPATAAAVALDAYRPARIYVVPLGIPALLDAAGASPLASPAAPVAPTAPAVPTAPPAPSFELDSSSRANEEDLR